MSSNMDSSRTLAEAVQVEREAAKVNESETPAKRMSPRRAAANKKSGSAVIVGATDRDAAAAAADNDSLVPQGASYPTTAQKKRKGAPAKLVTPNRDDDEIGIKIGVPDNLDDLKSPVADEPEEKREGTSPVPLELAAAGSPAPVELGTADAAALEVDTVPQQGEIQGDIVVALEDASVRAREGAPAVESAATLTRTETGPSRPDEAPVMFASDTQDRPAERPLKRRKVMLCAGAAVVAMATIFAPDSLRGTADVCCDTNHHHSKAGPSILFRNLASKSVGKVGVGMPAPMALDARSPSRTPTKRLGSSANKLPNKERQPTWNVSFLSGLLSPSDVKVDPTREVTVRPLSSFSPFKAQRDALRSVVVDPKKAVAVRSKPPPNEQKGPGPLKNLAGKFREAAAQLASAAAEAVAGATPMNHVQG